MGVYLEKLTFNSRLDNSRKHVVHGERTRSACAFLLNVTAAGKGGSPCMVCRALCLLEE